MFLPSNIYYSPFSHSSSSPILNHYQYTLIFGCCLTGLLCSVHISSFFFFSPLDWIISSGLPLSLLNLYPACSSILLGPSRQAAVHGVAKSQTRLSDFTFTFHYTHWRRQWQPTPVFLPGESQGRGSLVSCHLWGHTESDTTEATQQQQQQQ